MPQIELRLRFVLRVDDVTRVGDQSLSTFTDWSLDHALAARAVGGAPHVDVVPARET